VKASVETLEDLTELVADRNATIRHLGQLLLPAPRNSSDPHLASCAAQPPDYLAELQRHAREPAAAPTQWITWNYYGLRWREMAYDDLPGRKGSSSVISMEPCSECL
jgi:hypothetical protein